MSTMSLQYPQRLYNVYLHNVHTVYKMSEMSLSTRVSAFISLALVVVLVVQNNKNSHIKLIQIILDQLLILNGIKLFPNFDQLFCSKHD